MKQALFCKSHDRASGDLAFAISLSNWFRLSASARLSTTPRHFIPAQYAIPGEGSSLFFTHLSEDSLVAVLTLTFCVFILLFLLSGG
ncbi:hypothetical protein ACX13C_25785 [Klebsiella oxytoca]